MRRRARNGGLRIKRWYPISTSASQLPDKIRLHQ
jgi:hypothetical protein